MRADCEIKKAEIRLLVSALSLGSGGAMGPKGSSSRAERSPASLTVSRRVVSHPASVSCRAEALQSMFLLMSPRQLFEHYRDDYEIHDISWSEEKAAAVLEAWQREFVEVRWTGWLVASLWELQGCLMQVCARVKTQMCLQKAEKLCAWKGRCYKDDGQNCMQVCQ